MATFDEAVRALKRDGTAHREGWGEDDFITLSIEPHPILGPMIVLHQTYDDNVLWEPTHEDILAEDWLVD